MGILAGYIPQHLCWVITTHRLPVGPRLIKGASFGRAPNAGLLTDRIAAPSGPAECASPEQPQGVEQPHHCVARKERASAPAMVGNRIDCSDLADSPAYGERAGAGSGSAGASGCSGCSDSPLSESKTLPHCRTTASRFPLRLSTWGATVAGPSNPASAATRK